ncbi:hypothetical protein FKF73_21780 [Aeromonas hydrophila]|nr:hypothetical protein C2U40_10875 [Aeromonas sp. ASNIH4]MBX9564925.1 hypothetical protein [Aeromonas hydrophila]POV91242.1 hypothetical protein C3395_00735 [Aeromonas sp. ASNIH6]POU42390.1 hypothetical protein C3405_00565 [Aeromonas hydrophila]QBX73772.1 hypothetical protein E4625_10640 [Aeromonas hydrophila]
MGPIQGVSLHGNGRDGAEQAPLSPLPCKIWRGLRPFECAGSQVGEGDQIMGALCARIAY